MSNLPETASNLKIFYSICLACLLTAPAFCQQQNAPVAMEDGYLPKYTAAQLLAQLERIASGNHKDSLKTFFLQWHRAIPAKPISFINHNDTIRAVYDVYRSFYRPLHLLELGDWEWGNKLNEGAQYVIVNTAINYQCTGADTLDVRKYEETFGTGKPEESMIALFDFRPTVNVDSSKVLYLTGEYETALNRFLGSKSTALGEGNIMNPSLPAGESERRYTLLRPYIPILHGHWGGYWHLETHPEVFIIVFNRTLTQAVVNFRVGYQGGTAVLRNNNGVWKLEKSGTTWIE